MDLEGFNIVDGVVLLVLLVSAVLAFSRGFVREVMSIAGWVIAAFAAFTFAGQVEPLIREIPYLDAIIGSSCELSILAAFAIVFAIALVVVSIFTPLFAGMVSNSALSPMDQGLGLLFGVARGVLLVAIALVVYDIWSGGNSSYAPLEESQTRIILADFQAKLEAQIPDDAPGWIANQYEKLTGSCE